eukprot:TRINITY_DN2844_c0_g1_i2.p1 TRINITY_DN2844_c0_g1~~TRINITY_DN2844_c0_g1_i2.p1  ORF type:complete len:965 (+),score=306.28 TRINITY_DN2844_c0_g1_i2:196-3090(+)
MQAIVTELGLPDEKSIPGLQKAVQLSASGVDISLLFSSIHSLCFGRSKPRTVRLLAYEAMGACTASVPQWRSVMDAVMEDVAGDDEELVIAALNLLPRIPIELLMELIILGRVNANTFELVERSLHVRHRIIGCLTTLLLYHPALTLELAEFAVACWRIVFAALNDVDSCVAACAFKTIHNVVAILVNPHNSKLSFDTETSCSHVDLLELPRKLIVDELVPSFQKLLQRALVLDPESRWTAYMPLCWLALHSSEGTDEMRAAQTVSQLVLKDLHGSTDLATCSAAADAILYIVRHPAVKSLVERPIWIEDSASVVLSILRNETTESHVRCQSSKFLLALVPEMDARPQFRVQCLYSILAYGRKIDDIEHRLEVLMLAAKHLLHVSLSSPESYINGLFTLECVENRDRAEFLLALVTACFELLHSADKESVDRSSYVVECVLTRLRAFLYWECSECVLGLFELFRLIDHMCSEIKSPAALELLSQMPSSFAAIKSDKRCLRCCLLVLKNITDESVVDGVFQALETRFLSFLWANSDVDRDLGLLGSKRPDKKEPSADIFEELITCLAVMGIRFQSRRERIMDILSRLADIVSDPLHAARVRSLVKRVSVGALGQVGFQLGASFVACEYADASDTANFEIYEKQFLCLARFNSEYANWRVYSSKSMDEQRRCNQWKLLSPTSSPIMIEAYHLLNPGDRKITLFIKAGNNVIFPLENVQLECRTKGMRNDARSRHVMTRIDRLHFQEVYDWQVNFSATSLNTCSVSVLVRFLSPTELYPDIRTCQDDVDGESAPLSPSSSMPKLAPEGVKGGPYLPPVHSLEYELPLFSFVMPVEISLSEFLSQWNLAPGSEIFDLRIPAERSLEDIVQLFSMSGALHCVMQKSFGSNHVQVALHGLSWFQDILQMTLCGKKTPSNWQVRLEVRASCVSALAALHDAISTWLQGTPTHGVALVDPRDEAHLMSARRD